MDGEIRGKTAHRARIQWQLRLVVIVVLLATLAGMISPVAASSGRRNSSAGSTTASAPAPGATGESGGIASGTDAPAHAPVGQAVPCDSLSENPTRFKDTGLVDCLRYSTQHINGSDYSLYYPVEWEPNGGWGYGYMDRAQEAIEQSAKTFGQWGTMGNVTVVFSLLNLDNGTAYANANVYEFLTTQPCTVAIFTPLAELGEDQFRQVLSHEIFHCFEFWNYPEQFNLKVTDWWVEGLAEYFSNVAYPNVNFEWTRIPEYDEKAEQTPFTRMSYEACVLWQYLANEIGNDGILQLLHALPTAGGEREQQEALRNYPGFADLYQRFAEAYVDKAIVDTGGGTMPVSPDVYHMEKVIPGTSWLEFEVDPFAINRFSWTFAPDPKIAIQVLHDNLKYGSRSAGTVGVWDEMPKAIDCDDPRDWVTAVTSLTIAPEKDAKFRYDFTGLESECKANVCGTPSASAPATGGGNAATSNADSCDAAPIDTCLIGTWKVTDAEDYFLDAYAVVNPVIDLTYAGIDGSLTYTFDEAEVTVTADAFVIKAGATIAEMAADIVVGIEGSTTAPYHVNPDGLSGEAVSVPRTFTIIASVYLDGEEIVSNEVGDLVPLIGGAFDYSCKGNTLKFSSIMPDGRGLPPMTLKRQK